MMMNGDCAEVRARRYAGIKRVLNVSRFAHFVHCRIANSCGKVRSAVVVCNGLASAVCYYGLPMHLTKRKFTVIRLLLCVFVVTSFAKINLLTKISLYTSIQPPICLI